MDIEQKQNEVVLAPYGFNATGMANKPNPTQLKILEWVDNVKAASIKDHIPVLYVQGGVGSGKSRGMLAPACEMLCEYSGLRMFWGRLDYKDIKLSIQDKFLEVMPDVLIANKS